MPFISGEWFSVFSLFREDNSGGSEGIGDYWTSYTNSISPTCEHDYHWVGLESYTNRDPEGYYCVSGWCYTVTTLSNEVTTADLMASFTNSFTPEWLPCGTESPHASVTMSSDETYVSGTNVQARFKVFARDGEAWDIPYYSHCKWWSNDVAFEATIATNHATGIGTGDWIYTNVSVVAPFPDAVSGDGASDVGVEAWITLDCQCQSQLRLGQMQYNRRLRRRGLGQHPHFNGHGARHQRQRRRLPAHSGFKASSGPDHPGRLQAMGDLWGGRVALGIPPAACARPDPRAVLLMSSTNSTGSLIVSFYAGQAGSQDPVTGFYDTSTNKPFASCTIDQSAPPTTSR